MNHKGFTLIELLVAIGILLLLLGMGITNYLSFNDRQKLTQAAETVRESVASAQISARSGKLRGCNELQAYRISMNNSGGVGVIGILPICAGTGATEQKDIYLPSGVNFSTTHTLYSRAVTGVIDDDLTPDNGDPPTTTITISNGNSLELIISQNGSVSVGEIE